MQDALHFASTEGTDTAITFRYLDNLLSSA